ncbi:MAG: hypothetical protein JO152_06145 [Mycobacteriaceae bacterium]|nr:hypothetical protein [Mycobacteriaceae bacterium]
MGAPPGGGEQQPHRPVDVGTGFGLWCTALPVLVVGQAVDMLTPGRPHGAAVYAMSGVFLFVVASVVLTFLILMWHRYRWARTLLTGAGIATIVYVTTSLFTAQRPPVAAVVFAITAIVGSVLIAGGAYLLHRKDTHAYFTR